MGVRGCDGRERRGRDGEGVLTNNLGGAVGLDLEVGEVGGVGKGVHSEKRWVNSRLKNVFLKEG